jgi:hypothetical protein
VWYTDNLLTDDVLGAPHDRFLGRATQRLANCAPDGGVECSQRIELSYQRQAGLGD